MNKDRNQGTWIAMGIALGVAVGAAFDNIGLGIALGVAFGAAMGGLSAGVIRRIRSRSAAEFLGGAREQSPAVRR